MIMLPLKVQYRVALGKEAKRLATCFLSGDEGVSDEYYINEIIGIDEFTYTDWIGGKK